MNAVLWIVALLLASLFLLAGAMKLFRPKQDLRDRGLGWVDWFPAWFVKAIGGVEVLAALGLVVAPLVGHGYLAPAAAGGIMALMVGAAITHLRRGEPLFMGLNALVTLLAAVIVWGRLGPYPF